MYLLLTWLICFCRNIKSSLVPQMWILHNNTSRIIFHTCVCSHLQNVLQSQMPWSVLCQVCPTSCVCINVAADKNFKKDVRDKVCHSMTTSHRLTRCPSSLCVSGSQARCVSMGCSFQVMSRTWLSSFHYVELAFTKLTSAYVDTNHMCIVVPYLQLCRYLMT